MCRYLQFYLTFSLTRDKDTILILLQMQSVHESGFRVSGPGVVTIQSICCIVSILYLKPWGYCVPALSSSSWLLSGDRMEIGVTATPGDPGPGHPDHRPPTLGWRLIILSNLASSRQRPGDQIFQISHLPQIMFLIIENIFNLDDFLQKVYSFWKVKCSDNVLSGACLQLWSWFKMQQRR